MNGRKDIPFTVDDFFLSTNQLLFPKYSTSSKIGDSSQNNGFFEVRRLATRSGRSGKILICDGSMHNMKLFCHDLSFDNA